jgi:hypothetical protein
MLCDVCLIMTVFSPVLNQFLVLSFLPLTLSSSLEDSSELLQ